MVRQDQCTCCYAKVTAALWVSTLWFFSWLLIEAVCISLRKVCQTPEENPHKESHWHSHILWLFSNTWHETIFLHTEFDSSQKKFIPVKEPTEKYKHHLESHWRTKLSKPKALALFPGVDFILDGILNRDEAFPFYCFFPLSQPINTINTILTSRIFQSTRYGAVHSSSHTDALCYAICFPLYLHAYKQRQLKELLKGKSPAWVAVMCFPDSSFQTLHLMERYQIALLTVHEQSA